MRKLRISAVALCFLLLTNNACTQPPEQGQPSTPGQPSGQAQPTGTLERPTAEKIFLYTDGCKDQEETDHAEAIGTLQKWLDGALAKEEVPSDGGADCYSSCLITCCPNRKCKSTCLANCVNRCP